MVKLDCSVHRPFQNCFVSVCSTESVASDADCIVHELAEIVNRLYPEHADALMNLFERFVYWVPTIGRVSDDLEADVQNAVFWAKAIKTRFVTLDGWRAHGLEECFMSVSRLEASTSDFYALLDRKTMTRADRRIGANAWRTDVFTWLKAPFERLMVSPPFRRMSNHIQVGLVEVFGFPLARLSMEMLFPALCLSCMFVLHDMPTAAVAFRRQIELWLKGTPIVGLDRDLRIMILVASVPG